MKVSIKVASQHLGVSSETLRRWERDGKLPAYRTNGGHRRYDLRDLDRLIAGQPQIPAELLLDTETCQELLAQDLSVVNIEQLTCLASSLESPDGARYSTLLVPLILTQGLHRLVIIEDRELSPFTQSLLTELCQHQDVQLILTPINTQN